jgi:hypothetical protein
MNPAGTATTGWLGQYRDAVSTKFAGLGTQGVLTSQAVIQDEVNVGTGRPRGQVGIAVARKPQFHYAICNCAPAANDNVKVGLMMVGCHGRPIARVSAVEGNGCLGGIAVAGVL